MSAGSFQQDSLGWRINLVRQRFSEWREYRLSQLDLDWNLDYPSLKLLWQIVKICLWAIIAVLIVWLVWQAWLLLRPYWRGWQRSSDRFSPLNSPSIAPQLSAADWVERSQTARIEADYRRAIFCLYQAMLKLLDEREIMSIQPSFTDEEYRRSLLQRQISPSQPYETLLSIHQRLCFSQAEADRALFESCQQAYRQIETS